MAAAEGLPAAAAAVALSKPRPPSAPGASERISVREASAIEVYNIPLFEIPPMLDVRSTADYAEGHVICAVSVPAEDGLVPGELLRRIVEHDEVWGWCLQHPFVVVYDDATAQRAAWLVDVLRETVSSDAQAVGGSPSLLRRLCSQLRQVLLLRHRPFAEAFPACCAPGPAWTADAFFERVGALPRCALAWPRVFLAGRQVLLSAELIQTLGITHAIVNADSYDVMDSTSGGGGNGFMPADRFGDVPGVKYLKCTIPDRSDDPDLCSVFEGAVEFLKTCADERGAALIRVHGQSRGASLACAWLMAEQGLSADAALSALLTSGIQGLDQTLLWWSALERFTPGPRAPRKRPLEDGKAD